MSSEIPSPLEFASNPSGNEAIRRILETMSIGPEMMHAFAKETMQAAELLGTNLTLDVRKKVSNPHLFSYDYKAEAIEEQSDGPNHEGFAKIFVATEGVKPMIGGTEGVDATGAVNMVVRQVLKANRKGMESINLKPGDEPIVSKEGKLNAEQTNRLALAEQAVVDDLLYRLAGSDDSISEESGIAVANWVGSGADRIDGMAIVADIGDRMAPLLTELVKLAEQGE